MLADLPESLLLAIEVINYFVQQAINSHKVLVNKTKLAFRVLCLFLQHLQCLLQAETYEL